MCEESNTVGPTEIEQTSIQMNLPERCIIPNKIQRATFNNMLYFTMDLSEVQLVLWTPTCIHGITSQKNMLQRESNVNVYTKGIEINILNF